jgi:high affinity Mn2+ porin
MGFLLGDGRLDYRSERILESYYAFAIVKGLTTSLDFQRVWNPGYNADRGPVSLFALRCHGQF